MSEILHVLYLSFADEIKTRSALEFRGLSAKHVFFYLASEMSKLPFYNPPTQHQCLKLLICRLLWFTIIILTLNTLFCSKLNLQFIGLKLILPPQSSVLSLAEGDNQNFSTNVCASQFCEASRVD